jgi:endonuclease/exonuclease/phosphatase (EEP) superfamily protein YafD
MAVAVALLVYSTVALIARHLPLPNNLALVIAVSSAYVPLVTLSALALSVLSRHILLSIVAVFVVAATLAVQVRWYHLGHPTNVGRHADIRVLSSNLRKGQADASIFVALAKGNADVITVAELTPEEVNRFSQAGIDEAFPYSVLAPGPGAGGIGLWSRFPLAGLTWPEQAETTIVAARLHIPGVRLDPLVASVHVMSPLAFDENTFNQWRSGIIATKASLADFAAATDPGAVIVAGDFNSTPDMRQFRDLLTNGYRDAVQQTGAGFAPTFPSNEWFPPVITIDHVLTRNAAAAAIKTVTLPGSDHRSLLATIHVPLDPTAS